MPAYNGALNVSPVPVEVAQSAVFGIFFGNDVAAACIFEQISQICSRLAFFRVGEVGAELTLFELAQVLLRLGPLLQFEILLASLSS